MFDRSQKLVDDVDDDIKDLLTSINDRTVWTQRCKDELRDLKKALAKRKYTAFLGHPNRYHLSTIGESCLYDVPLDRRGELKIFRGMRVRIVCVSSGRYTRLLMAGVICETPKNLQVRREARQYVFPEHNLSDVVYKSPRYLVIRKNASNPIRIETTHGEAINLEGADYVMFDGTLHQLIVTFRHDEGGFIRAGLIGYREDERAFKSLHIAIRSLIKESIRNFWLFKYHRPWDC